MAVKLLFRQRFFSWFDSYDIYDEAGRTVYTVEGKLSWGHRLEIYGPAGDHLGTVKEEVLTFLPRFALYIGEEYLGCIRKEFTFFRPRFQLDCSGWQVEGNFLEWDYTVVDRAGGLVMQASKELFHWTDTYTLDIVRPEDALLCLMIVLAIDAAKCSAGN
nr:LURP-one-related family protein [Lawsonibacter celer]